MSATLSTFQLLRSWLNLLHPENIDLIVFALLTSHSLISSLKSILPKNKLSKFVTLDTSQLPISPYFASRSPRFSSLIKYFYTAASSSSLSANLHFPTILSKGKGNSNPQEHPFKENGEIAHIFFVEFSTFILNYLFNIKKITLEI